MHPETEKLQRLYLDAQTDPASVDLFYDALWIPGGILDPEVCTLATKMDELIHHQIPVQQKYLAISKLAIGYNMFHLGQYESSLMELAEAKKLFSEIHDEDMVQCVAVMLGCNYRTMGELDLALKYLLDAYLYLSKTEAHKIFLGFCVYMLAEIYSESGNYDEALQFHEILEKLMFELENKYMLARALNGTGVVYQHLKRYSLTLEYLMGALNLSAEAGDLPVKARALTDLGSYYFELGDYAAAASYQRQALQIRTEMNIPGAVTNMIHLAKLSALQNNTEETITTLNTALRLAKEFNVKPKIFQIHLMLSEIYQSKHELAQSLSHYQNYHEVREEVLHEDNEKKIRNLKLIFEAEQTQKENIIIKKQKEEIQNKNIELQDTIDELTLTKVSRKAKTLTLLVAVILFIFEDPIVGFGLRTFYTHNYYASLAVKMLIIFSLSPINAAIQGYLLKKVMKNRKRQQQLLAVTQGD